MLNYPLIINFIVNLFHSLSPGLHGLEIALSNMALETKGNTRTRGRPIIKMTEYFARLCVLTRSEEHGGNASNPEKKFKGKT